jgi:hypothetical protein
VVERIDATMVTTGSRLTFSHLIQAHGDPVRARGRPPGGPVTHQPSSVTAGFFNSPTQQRCGRVAGQTFLTAFQKPSAPSPHRGYAASRLIPQIRS